jgi:hypothetical protein
MTPSQTMQSKWQAMKPMVFALTIGLVAGPLITNYIGWQVTSGTARAETRDSVLQQFVSMCAERARADVADATKLDWNARSDLAKKWAVAPVAPFADLDVRNACTARLAA